MVATESYTEIIEFTKDDGKNIIINYAPTEQEIRQYIHLLKTHKCVESDIYADMVLRLKKNRSDFAGFERYDDEMLAFMILFYFYSDGENRIVTGFYDPIPSHIYEPGTKFTYDELEKRIVLNTSMKNEKLVCIDNLLSFISIYLLKLQVEKNYNIESANLRFPMNNQHPEVYSLEYSYSISDECC